MTEYIVTKKGTIETRNGSKVKEIEIEIHRGLRIHARYRGDSVFVSVRDDAGEDQITFVQRGPDDIVVRAMRDALSRLLGD